ncbi:MAG: hypothetical protein ACOX17_02570 [Christensenellales bacterium]
MKEKFKSIAITVLCLSLLLAGCQQKENTLIPEDTLIPGVQWGMTEGALREVLGEGEFREIDAKHSWLTLPVQVGGVDAEAAFSFYLAPDGEEAFPEEGVRRLVSIEITGEQAMDAVVEKLLGAGRSGDSVGNPDAGRADSLVWQSDRTYADLPQSSRDWLAGYQAQLFAQGLAETETVPDDTPLWRCYVLKDDPRKLWLLGTLSWALAAEKAVAG